MIGITYNSITKHVVLSDGSSAAYGSAEVTNGADGTYYYAWDVLATPIIDVLHNIDKGSGSVIISLEITTENDIDSLNYTQAEDTIKSVPYSYTVNGRRCFDFENDDNIKDALFARWKVVANTSAADDSSWTIYQCAL